jgi:hypothetical protein
LEKLFPRIGNFSYRISIGNALLEIQENLYITSDGTESGGLRVEG